MKKLTSIIMAFLFIILFCGTASATLMKIGSATYLGAEYNLIWDNSNGGLSVVWFDYINVPLNQIDQKSWANSLDTNLTIHVNTALFQVEFTTGWHLPEYPSEIYLSDEPDRDSVFENLYSTGCWTQHNLMGNGLVFNPYWGTVDYKLSTSLYEGLALARATVADAPVPIPTAVWLFGSGLASLVAFRRRQKGRSI